MSEFERGDRVMLVATTDEHTDLQPGALGTVSIVDGLGTVHMRWDCGSTLGMIAEAGDLIVKVLKGGSMFYLEFIAAVLGLLIATSVRSSAT